MRGLHPARQPPGRAYCTRALYAATTVDASTQTLASDPIRQTLCPLTLQMRRAGGALVGRSTELNAIEAELDASLDALSGITLEGEPGIGKTRLLVAASQLGAERGFSVVAVAADEELRGPFLLMRSILASMAGSDVGLGAGAAARVDRALEAMSGRTDPSLEQLPPDQKLLRQFDLAALALQAAAAERPLAILADNVQWADDDSLRTLRYAVRTVATSRIFLLLAMRPDETALVTEAVTLVADMERGGLTRRLRLGRFTAAETTAFLRHHLGGDVAPTSAATIHAQAEGVPFILEELARAYRDAGMIQQIDGRWSLAKNADRLAPSAVQTLIQRRSGRLPEETKAALAEAAVLGRSFSVRDLHAVRARLGDSEADADPARLADALAPAVAAGLLHQHPAGAPADFGFTHEQIRQYALGAISGPRRRAIHAAIVAMLADDVDPTPESLPLLAQHAAAAGDAERCARFSIDAAQAALTAHAPEEVLRSTDVALPIASDPRDRVTLLSLRDDALAMLRRPLDRLEGLAELGALAEALGDPHLELHVRLRRAAAFRLADEFDRAADLARGVAEAALERGDEAAELAARLELGQALVHVEMGEGFVPAAAELDLDAANEAFGRAAELAEALGDEAALAAASRELGCIQIGYVRAWFVERVKAGEHLPFLARSVGGESLDDMLMTLPIAPNAMQASQYLQRALELFEKLGDRRGVMSSIIAMAYQRFGADVHIGMNAAQRIEEIRRLAMRLRSLSKESERAAADAQMAYGVHVFSRAKVIPDLAIARGEEAFWAAKSLGDRSLEFLAAGGTAMAYLDIGASDDAERWLGHAAAAAAASPTPLRARRLEFWRALAHARRGDVDRMREHFDRALRLAQEQGRPAARCEILARRALEAARLGALLGDEGLLELAETSAAEAKDLVPSFVAHQPWGAYADAAMADVLLARGDASGAARSGLAVAGELQEAMREDVYPEMLLPAARGVLAGGDDASKQMVRTFLQLLLALTAQRTVDESVRVRWFKGPIGSEWVRLAGPVSEEGIAAVDGGGGNGGGALAALDEDERRLLGFLMEGMTTHEVAERGGVDEGAVRLQLQSLFAKVGASSLGEATAFALREGVV